VPGYQVTAATMRWVARGGSVVHHDPIRIPNPPEEGSRPNLFFLDFYRHLAADGQGLEAREHTAQVPSEVRGPSRYDGWPVPGPICPPPKTSGEGFAPTCVADASDRWFGPSAGPLWTWNADTTPFRRAVASERSGWAAWGTAFSP
jgi:hypothetical protein